MIQPVPEKAILVGVALKSDRGGWSLQSSLDELAQLADTAGAEVVGRLVQRLERPSPTYYLGSGKLQELVALKAEVNYDVVIFDDELSPRQQRNLEEILQAKIVDRTALVLDIFAGRAQSREGQLQAELAQYEYLLPRLIGRWTHLERLGGGIGTRGPGESQLETDRRLVRRRISHLKAQIEQVRKHRRLYREQRKRSGISIVSIVGYTNSGKSTLLNTLSDANVLVEDKLFATLDPVTRRLTLPDQRQILLTDTVGFIHKLPHTVVAAFKATLEELHEADLLLHVVDISHRNAAEQHQVVEETLADLGLKDKPRLVLLNKVDLIMKEDEFAAETHPLPLADQLGADSQGMVLISAAKGWGLDVMLKMIARVLGS